MPFTTKAQLVLKCADLAADIAGLPADAVPYTDNFNRPNENLEASPDWTLLDGTSGMASIVSNVLKSNTADTLGAAYACPDKGSSSMVVGGNFLSNANNSHYVVRLTNRSNFLGMRWNGTGIDIHKKIGGTASVITSFVTSRASTDIFLMYYDDAAGTFRVTKDTGSGPVEIIAPTSVGVITGLPASTRAGVVTRGIVGNFADNFFHDAF